MANDLASKKISRGPISQRYLVIKKAPWKWVVYDSCREMYYTGENGFSPVKEDEAHFFENASLALRILAGMDIPIADILVGEPAS